MSGRAHRSQVCVWKTICAGKSPDALDAASAGHQSLDWSLASIEDLHGNPLSDARKARDSHGGTHCLGSKTR